MLCQRRRCIGNFAPKYLAPCDVLEAKCGAQVYVVVVDVATGALVQADLGDTYLQLSLIDGRKLEAEGDLEDALDSCQLLLNKAGQPLLVHGRSGSYTDDHRVMVPMISGQAMLPDLKVTDSSEALLTGRAPPFRLLARVVQRGGIPFPGIAPVLSEPFVVATARVKGAAKAEIPHVDDHVSKVEGLGVQTQKKLEDIAAAAVAAGVPNVQVPINCVTKVGQFRELVETAERNKPLRETLKQVLRLTKGWDVARDHVRRAVHTDVQLRVYHPDGRTDVGLVYKCGTFNVVEINRPVGLLRRRQTSSRPDQELVDVIWLSVEASAWPEAVRRIVPRAASAWWQEGHPGWGFLPLSLGHLPLYGDDGKPSPPMSSYSFTMRPSPPASVLTGAGGAHPAVSNGAVPGLLLPGMVPIAPAAQVPSSTGAPVAPIEAPVSTAAAPQAAPQLPPGLPHPWAQFKANPPDLAALGNLGALPGVAGEHLPAPSSDTLPNIGGPTLGSGDTKIETGLSPFEDPSFQQLMQLVAGSTPPTSGQPAVPKSGDSDGGAKGKRKAGEFVPLFFAFAPDLNVL